LVGPIGALDVLEGSVFGVEGHPLDQQGRAADRHAEPTAWFYCRSSVISNWCQIAFRPLPANEALEELHGTLHHGIRQPLAERFARLVGVA
jgi:hypothetical protein